MQDKVGARCAAYLSISNTRWHDLRVLCTLVYHGLLLADHRSAEGRTLYPKFRQRGPKVILPLDELRAMGRRCEQPLRVAKGGYKVCCALPILSIATLIRHLSARENSWLRLVCCGLFLAACFILNRRGSDLPRWAISDEYSTSGTNLDSGFCLVLVASRGFFWLLA